MTQDEIIEMATQVYGKCNWHKSALLRLEAFVKLVEDKAIAKLESQKPVAWELGVVNGVVTRRPVARPQRTWVGLASEDRLTAKYMQDAPDGIEAVIDYIESKLKELNT